MSEVLEKFDIPKENSSKENGWLNNAIAVIVALSASFMAVFNIKDNNIVQSMSQAQAQVIDSWSYFQAKSTKQSIIENQISQLEIQMLTTPNLSSSSQQKFIAKIDEAKTKVEKYEKEKNEIKAQAEAYQKEYDELNTHDDQFDLAEALISLGLSIFGITALTQKKVLFYFAIALSSVGVFFGVAGFLGLSIHPEWLTKLLS